MTEATEKIIDQGLNVRIRRTSKKVKQEALAELIGISPQRLSKIEQQAVIDNEILDKIAKALDTNVDWFKTFDPDNDVAHYNIENNSNDTSRNNIAQGSGQTVINYPIDEVIKLADKAVAKVEELHAREIEILKQLADRDKEIALLKQKAGLLGKE